jgi:Ca2+-binding EF-hand superfamily protein
MAPPVPTELQIRKFRKRFRVLDSDGNGVLDVSDYETVAQRIPMPLR